MVKKQKLHHDKVEDLMSLGRASYASKSAIAGLCAHIRKHGVPDASDRRAQFRARKHMCQTATPYGNMVVELPVAFTDGRSAKLGFQNPLAFFHHHCSGSSHYAKIVSGAMRRSPCSPASPWNIIMYQDGVDPSDGLAKNHSRKSVVFYLSFAEFGMHALAHEEVWGTLCVMRSTQVKALHGQVVQLFDHTLSLFFGATHDIRLSGVSVDVKHGERAERATIFASVGVLLADEPALKELLHCKGHAGIKPCCLCMDATHHNTGGTPLHVLTDKAVSMTDTNLGAFTKHSDESIRSLVQRIDQHHDNPIAGMDAK